MKRIIPAILITVIFSLCTTGCNKNKQDNSFTLDNLPTQAELSEFSQSAPAADNDAQPDIDFTQMSVSEIYDEMFNMLIMPEEYEGKLIKAKGSFNVLENQNNGEQYYAILISDSDGDCQEGIEFVWPGSHKYPEDFPEKGQEITITGRYTVKNLEGGITYTYLAVTKLEQ